VSRLEDETPPFALYKTTPGEISQQATPSPPSFTLTSKIEDESPPSAFDNITPRGLSVPRNKHVRNTRFTSLDQVQPKTPARRHLPNVQVPKQPDFHRYPRCIQQLKLLPIPIKIATNSTQNTQTKNTHIHTHLIHHTNIIHPIHIIHPRHPRQNPYLRHQTHLSRIRVLGSIYKTGKKIVKPAKYFRPNFFTTTPPTE
jgi:hypothetical protein